MTGDLQIVYLRKERCMMKKNKYAEYFFSLLLIAVGIYVFVVGKGFRGNDKYFPMIIGAGMIVTAIWMVVEDMRQEKACLELSKINFAAVGITIAALFVYTVLFRTIGYVLSTILLGISIILGLRYDSIRGAVLWPTGIVLVVFAVFKILLKVPLPTVIW